MASIGRLSDTLTIRVFEEREKVEPHFHLTKGKGPNFDFECCVSLNDNKYYVHTFKGEPVKSKNGKLTKSQMNELDEFLNEVRSDLNVNNWKYLLVEWNNNNLDSVYTLSIDNKQPDYTKISGNISEK